VLGDLGDLGDRQSAGHRDGPTDWPWSGGLPSRRSLAQIADHLQIPVPVARARVHTADAALERAAASVLATHERGLLS
jgi:hypothetical protein